MSFQKTKLLPQNDIEYETPAVVYAAHIRLLSSLLKIAVSDWQQLNESEEEYCDPAHERLCRKANFCGGREELICFFESGWFERICDELDIDADRFINLLKIYED